MSLAVRNTERVLSRRRDDKNVESRLFYFKTCCSQAARYAKAFSVHNVIRICRTGSYCKSTFRTCMSNSRRRASKVGLTPLRFNPQFSPSGFIALARQKLKNDAKPPIEPPKAAYAQYFASNRQLVGYSRSLTNVFNSIRREHIDRLAMHTNQQLLRLDRLISMDVYAPRQGKTKERRSRTREAIRHCDVRKSRLSLRV